MVKPIGTEKMVVQGKEALAIQDVSVEDTQ